MKKVISSQKSPPAAGPYSQAVVSGGFVWVAMQIPLDPQSGAMPETPAGQIDRILVNLKGLLEDSGSSMANVVRVTLFLADMADFAVVNEVYARHFEGDYPARSTFQVCALPKGAKVALDAVAEAGR